MEFQNSALSAPETIGRPKSRLLAYPQRETRMLCRAGGQSPINGRLNEPNSCIDLSAYPAWAPTQPQMW